MSEKSPGVRWQEELVLFHYNCISGSCNKEINLINTEKRNQSHSDQYHRNLGPE